MQNVRKIMLKAQRKSVLYNNLELMSRVRKKNSKPRNLFNVDRFSDLIISNNYTKNTIDMIQYRLNERGNNFIENEMHSELFSDTSYEPFKLSNQDRVTENIEHKLSDSGMDHDKIPNSILKKDLIDDPTNNYLNFKCGQSINNNECKEQNTSRLIPKPCYYLNDFCDSKNFKRIPTKEKLLEKHKFIHHQKNFDICSNQIKAMGPKNVFIVNDRVWDDSDANFVRKIQNHNRKNYYIMQEDYKVANYKQSSRKFDGLDQIAKQDFGIDKEVVNDQKCVFHPLVKTNNNCTSVGIKNEFLTSANFLKNIGSAHEILKASYMLKNANNFKDNLKLKKNLCNVPIDFLIRRKQSLIINRKLKNLTKLNEKSEKDIKHDCVASLGYKTSNFTLKTENNSMKNKVKFENSSISSIHKNLHGKNFSSLKKINKIFDRNEKNSLSGSEDLFFGIYNVISDLGKGTYGNVKLAYNIIENRTVALKFISKKNVYKKNQIQRVYNEVKIMSLLSHPNICKLYRAVETVDDYVLELEYVKGNELFAYIKARKFLNEKEAKHIFLQVLDGVNYLHRHKIIHRDLKPENMIIDDTGSVKIIDFGFAGIFEYGEFCEVHCGSPYYASPEMVNSAPYIGPEVDIWSLGVILYSMVHGKQPFQGTEVKTVYSNILKCDYKLCDKLSPDLCDLISKMICLDVEKRLTTYEISIHKWFIPHKITNYDKKFICEPDMRIVHKLMEFGFQKQALIINLKDPLTTESNFYRLAAKKIGDRPSNFGKITSLHEFYQDMKNLNCEKPIENTQKYHLNTNKSMSTFVNDDKIKNKEISEKIMRRQSMLEYRCIEYIVSQGYRFKRQYNYIQVLIIEEESVLIRIFINDINFLKSKLSFVLICGDESAFIKIVENMINCIH